MIGTIVVVLLIVGLAVGGFFIYKKHKAVIDREAARIAEQAKEAADKVKKQ